MADDNAARKLDPPTGGIVRLQPHPDPNPHYDEWLERTKGWDDVFAFERRDDGEPSSAEK